MKMVLIVYVKQKHVKSANEKIRKACKHAHIYDETTVTPVHDEIHTKAPSSIFHCLSVQLQFARAKIYIARAKIKSCERISKSSNSDKEDQIENVYRKPGRKTCVKEIS